MMNYSLYYVILGLNVLILRPFITEIKFIAKQDASMFISTSAK